jgi:hypothetical protein
MIDDTINKLDCAPAAATSDNGHLATSNDTPVRIELSL